MREPSSPQSPPPRGLFTVAFDELILVVILMAILLAFQVRVSGFLASVEGGLATGISPDGSLLAIADGTGSGVFDLETSRFLYHLSGRMWDLRFSPDGRHLVAVDMDGSARLLESRSGRLVQKWDDPGDTRVVRFHPDGSFLATASQEGPIRFRPLDGKGPVGEIDPKMDIHRIAFGEGGDLLFVAGCDRIPGNVLQIWELDPLRPRQTLRAGRDSFVFGLTASRDGSRVAVASRDPLTLRVWDVPAATPSPLPVVSTCGVMEFSGDGRYLLHGDLESKLTLTDTLEGTSRRLPGRVGMSSDARFLDGGRTVVAAHPQGPVVFLDVETGRLLREVPYAFASPLSGLALGGFGAWLVLWFAAYRLRRRHPDRPTGRPERGVYLLAYVATAWVLTRSAFGLVMSYPLTIGELAGTALVLGLFMMGLSAVVLSLVALVLGLTRRFRGRLIFIIPSLVITIWMIGFGLL